MRDLPCMPTQVTLRHLIHIQSVADPEHTCLLPLDPTQAIPAQVLARSWPAFRCPCGAVYDAVVRPMSFTTEYSSRCLRSLRTMSDEQGVLG